MLTKSTDKISSTTELLILKEEKKFREALTADAEFSVLKAIRLKIKQLKARLSEKPVPGTPELITQLHQLPFSQNKI